MSQKLISTMLSGKVVYSDKAPVCAGGKDRCLALADNGRRVHPGHSGQRNHGPEYRTGCAFWSWLRVCRRDIDLSKPGAGAHGTYRDNHVLDRAGGLRRHNAYGDSKLDGAGGG